MFRTDPDQSSARRGENLSIVPLLAYFGSEVGGSMLSVDVDSILDAMMTDAMVIDAMVIEVILCLAIGTGGSSMGGASMI